MRCKKIQELLKSDYLDGQANQSEEQFVKEHLAHCAQCRSLEEELRAQKTLLQNAQQLPVPEGIWQNIRQAIVNEELKQNSGIIEQVRNYFFAPRPVFVLASAFTMIIFVIAFFAFTIQKGRFSGKIGDTSSDVAIYSLNGESDNLLHGLGTDIEKYFL